MSDNYNMHFKKTERDKILKIMNKFRNIGFLSKLKYFFICLIPCYVDEGGELNCIVLLLKIVPFVLAVVSFISPYYMLYLFIKYSYPTYFIFFSFIASIFFSISYIGILGKGMVCCLTYPSNWFFLMFCSDFITIICNTFNYFNLKNYSEELNDYINLGRFGIIGNNLFCFIFFIQHYKAYRTINLVYTVMILMELDCIYYGSHKIFNCPINK